MHLLQKKESNSESEKEEKIKKKKVSKHPSTKVLVEEELENEHQMLIERNDSNFYV